MAIVYALCGYFLICLIVKLLMAKNRQKKEEKREKKIFDFFMSNSKEISTNMSQITKFAQDDLLFIYICDYYIKFNPHYTLQRQQTMADYMQNLIEDKINSLRKKDVQTRCLILRYLCQMGIHSDIIHQFVYECKMESELEQLWLKEICLSENQFFKEIPTKDVLEVE